LTSIARPQGRGYDGGMIIEVTVTKDGSVVGSATVENPLDGEVAATIKRAMDRARAELGDAPLWPCVINVRDANA
jgi:hypothetical protein